MDNEKNNFLSKLEKVPTQVPNDEFFDSLKIQVVDKLKTEQKIIPFYRKTWIQAAASILITVGIGTFYLFNSKTPEIQSKAKVDFSSLSKDDILKYIEKNSEDFEENDLAYLLTDLPDIGTSIAVQTTHIKTKQNSELESMWNDLNDEEILEYLQDESEDLDEELIFGI